MSISQEQVSSVFRHVATFAGGALTLAGTMAFLSASQTVDAQAALQDIIQGLSQAWAGAWKMGVIIGPMIGLMMAKWGWTAGSPGAQAKSLGQTQPDGSVKVLATPAAPADVITVANDKSPETKNVEMSPPSVVIDKKVSRRN